MKKDGEREKGYAKIEGKELRIYKESIKRKGRELLESVHKSLKVSDRHSR